MRSSLERAAIVGPEAAAAATPVFGTVARVDRDAAAQLDGYRRGRAEGHRDGLNEGRALAQQAVVDAVSQLRTAAAALEQRQQDSVGQVAELATRLALELAEAIVGGDLALLETGEDVIVRALGLRRQGEEVRIRVHPDHPALQDQSPRPGVEIMADVELGPNQVVADIGEGVADLSIDAAIARVREALR